MDNDILNALNDIGFTEFESIEYLNSVIQDISPFSKLVSDLTNQLSDLCKFDERINPIDSLNDLSTFAIEVSSYLKEMKSPYWTLFESININERFSNNENRMILLNHICTELQAASMIAVDNPNQLEIEKIVKISENEEANLLKKVLITLGFPEPPANITFQQIWPKIESRITEILKRLPSDYLSKPLLTTTLTDSQWKLLKKINDNLNSDFKSRREMLLKRLDVTVQSFKWADRLKSKNDEITKVFLPKRNELNIYSNIELHDLLAAREDLCQQEKTCSTRTMTATKLHKIIIGQVPDRGGRTSELEPPPPEMPTFKKRQQQQGAPQRQQRVQSGRGGHRGGGGGGGWSHDNNYRPQSDFERFQNPDYADSQGGGSGYYQPRGKSSRGGGGRRY